MSDRRTTADDHEDDRFDDLPDGSGCTEIWELLSDRREADD